MLDKVKVHVLDFERLQQNELKMRRSFLYQIVSGSGGYAVLKSQATNVTDID